jgi:hypothetical protein
MLAFKGEIHSLTLDRWTSGEQTDLILNSIHKRSGRKSCTICSKIEVMYKNLNPPLISSTMPKKAPSFVVAVVLIGGHYTVWQCNLVD